MRKPLQINRAAVTPIPLKRSYRRDERPATDSRPSRRVATISPPLGGEWAARHETEDVAGPGGAGQKRKAIWFVKCIIAKER
jgi:hypothetical protein